MKKSLALIISITTYASFWRVAQLLFPLGSTKIGIKKETKKATKKTTIDTHPPYISYFFGVSQ